MLQRIVNRSSWMLRSHSRPFHLQLYHRSVYHFSIKLNSKLGTTDDKDAITAQIDKVYNEQGLDGIVSLADSTFDTQDFNVTALSYERLINLYENGRTDESINAYFDKLDTRGLFELYYKFVATLHLIKDYQSAKEYIEESILPRFGEDYDGKLYGMYALILKEGFNDMDLAETYFKKSIDLSPGIENLFSYLNYTAILYNKEEVDWQKLYDFSLDTVMSFASYDTYIVAQHGITCTALHKYEEAEQCLNKVLDIYSKNYAPKSNEQEEQFVSYFPDLSHISARCLLQILFQFWCQHQMDDKIMAIHQRIEADYHEKNIWISKYLLQFISPIVAEMYWVNKADKTKAIECIFANDLLLRQDEYFEPLRFIHAFKYWAELHDLNCVDVLQHEDLHPFFFGCLAVINGLFEHNHGQLLATKHAFDSIPKEKVKAIHDEIEKYKAQFDEIEYEERRNLLIFNYVYKLMQQMFHDTLNKICKMAWGNISIYQFESAQEIADNVLKLEPENLTAYGIMLRIETEQKQYAKAIEIFETNITEEKCNDDEMMYFNLMPYYAISLCFAEDNDQQQKGNEIFDTLLKKIEEDTKDEMHVIHKEQIYRWYAYKLQYVDGDHKNAIEFYNKSFLQDELMKYPPVQMELSKCYIAIGDMDKAKEALEEAYKNGQKIFGEFIETEYKNLSEQIQRMNDKGQ